MVGNANFILADYGKRWVTRRPRRLGASFDQTSTGRASERTYAADVLHYVAAGVCLNPFSAFNAF